LHHDARRESLGIVRTTVDLDEPLLRRLRRRALQQRRTLSELVREAVTSYLSATAPGEEPPFELLEEGRSGGYAPSPQEMAAENDREDAAPLAGARRDRS